MRFALIVAGLSGFLASASAFAIPVPQDDHDHGHDHGHDVTPHQKRTMNVVIDMAKAVRLAEEMVASLPVGKRIAKALNAATDAATLEGEIDPKTFFKTVTKRLEGLYQDDTESESDEPSGSDSDTSDQTEGEDLGPEGEVVPDAPEFPEGEEVVVEECENVDDPCGGVPEF